MRHSLSSRPRIAVLCEPHFGFCYGTSTPRGPLAVKIRHLKILGYDPVLVRLGHDHSLSLAEQLLILILFFQVTEQELQSASEEFLRERVFPEHQQAEQPGP